CPGRPMGHNWRVRTANGTSRHYVCCTCGFRVNEKKSDGYWVAVSAVAAEPLLHAGENVLVVHKTSTVLLSPPETRNRRESRSAMPGIQSPRSTIESMEEDGVSPGTDTDSDNSMSIYESAPEDQPPKTSSGVQSRLESTRRSSAESPRSDARELLFESPSLPRLARLPARPGSDLSSPIARPPQLSARRGVIANVVTPSMARPTLDRRVRSGSRGVDSERWPLVSEYPKPPHPVATEVDACRDGLGHSWTTRGSNGIVRRYTCQHCGFLVRERKSEFPGGQVWLPAD
ncbi:hypothetical protein BD414DRAFT_418031, partial [Trametes punicea]